MGTSRHPVITAVTPATKERFNGLKYKVSAEERKEITSDSLLNKMMDYFEKHGVKRTR